MNGTTRAAATLLAAAVAGVLIWLAAQVGDESTGGYWATYGLIAAAGLAMALPQLRGRGGNPLAFFLLTFLPVLVAAGWIVVAAQPDGNWFRGHVLAWSSDIQVQTVVKDLAEYAGIFAFGIGLVFGMTFEPGMLRRRRRAVAGAGAVPATATATPARTDFDRTATNEPLAAERREVGDEPVVDEREAERRETAPRH
ncbi:MAG TPA: hypothetical protein VGJ77_05875 [Gaiellaceae bacterium]|jgi:hypothetical protein